MAAVAKVAHSSAPGWDAAVDVCYFVSCLNASTTTKQPVNPAAHSSSSSTIPPDLTYQMNEDHFR
jgi:hypothetical protein